MPQVEPPAVAVSLLTKHAFRVTIVPQTTSHDGCRWRLRTSHFLALNRTGGPQLAGAMASPIKEP